MKTGPKCAGYHTYWTMVTFMRSAREVQTTSSGRIIGGTVLEVTSRGHPITPNQGVPSRQTVWLLSGAARVTTWKSPSKVASRNRPLLTC